MSTKRDTYKYHFKFGRRIVHTGITDDLDRRGIEHHRMHGWGRGHMTKVGRRTTRDAALAWEREMGRKGYPVRRAL